MRIPPAILGIAIVLALAAPYVVVQFLPGSLTTQVSNVPFRVAAGAAPRPFFITEKPLSPYGKGVDFLNRIYFDPIGEFYCNSTGSRSYRRP